MPLAAVERTDSIKTAGINNSNTTKLRGFSGTVSSMIPEQQAKIMSLRKGTTSTINLKNNVHVKRSESQRINISSSNCISASSSSKIEEIATQKNNVKSHTKPSKGKPASIPVKKSLLARTELPVLSTVFSVKSPFKSTIIILPRDTQNNIIITNDKISSIKKQQKSVLEQSNQAETGKQRISTLIGVYNNTEGDDKSHQKYQRSGNDFDSIEQPAEQEYYYDQAHICEVIKKDLVCLNMEKDKVVSQPENNSIKEQDQTNKEYDNTDSNTSPCYEPEVKEVQDGVYFLQILDSEIQSFEKELLYWNGLLNSFESIPEDARDSIVTVIGMAKLLISSKLNQFRGLCNSNIEISRGETSLRPTNDDLGGFWDMVNIQITQIHKRFNSLRELNSNDWISKGPEEINKQKVLKAKLLRNKPVKSSEKSETSKFKEEARRRMLNERRRLMESTLQKSDINCDIILVM